MLKVFCFCLFGISTRNLKKNKVATKTRRKETFDNSIPYRTYNHKH